MVKKPNPPFEELDYSLFVLPQDILESDDVLNFGFSKNATAQALWHCEDDKIFELMTRLEQAGLRKLSAKANTSGSYAILLEANSHQMIRITVDGKEEPHTDAPYMLQPLASLNDIPGYSVEILPKMYTLREIISDPLLAKKYGLKNPERDAEQLVKNIIEDAWHDGKFLFDPSLSNIGLVNLGDGKNVPIIMDRGATVDCDKIGEKHKIQFAARGYSNATLDMKNRLEPFIGECGITVDARVHFVQATDDYIQYLQQHVNKEPTYTNEEYREAQKAYLKQLQLKAGKINNVVSDDDMEALRYRKVGSPNPDAKPYDPDDTVYSRVVNNRLYVDELMKKVGDIIKVTNEDEVNSAIAKDGFCTFVKKVLDKKLEPNQKAPTKS